MFAKMQIFCGNKNHKNRTNIFKKSKYNVFYVKIENEMFSPNSGRRQTTPSLHSLLPVRSDHGHIFLVHRGTTPSEDRNDLPDDDFDRHRRIL